MFKNLKLSQQALILLLVPLIFEVLFVVGLSLQVSQFANLLNEVNRSREFGTAINELMSTVGEVAVDIDGIKRMRDADDAGVKSFVADVKLRLNDVDGSMRALNAFAPDARTLTRVKEICRPLTRITGATLAVMDAYDSGGALGMHALTKQLQNDPHFKFVTWRDQATAALEALFAAKKEQEMSYTARVSAQKSAFKRLIVFLALGGLVHLVIALTLWLAFSRGTADRFRILVDNTVRLSKGMPLHAPIGGKGEITHLDSVFQDMARSLAEAAQYKKDMIAMASHDLRTPLTSVSGFLELLSTGMYGAISADGAQFLQVAESNVKRLIRLINDLLDIERMESGKLEMEFRVTALDSVLERSRDAVVDFAHQQRVILKVEPTELVENLDAERIVQVLVNLLSNAIKFSPAGAAVTVTAEATPEYVEIRVVDQGRGIPKDFREKIFERFQQVESADPRAKGSSGLGLAISKAIIEGHHGRIGVESEPGKGSTFWFQIPRHQEGEPVPDWQLHVGGASSRLGSAQR